MTESEPQNQSGPDTAKTVHAWDTEVPDWMVKRDQQLALRRQTVRRLSEMQWSALCLATTVLIGVLAFRLAMLPLPPSQVSPSEIPVTMLTPPVVSPTATPSPEPFPVVVEPSPTPPPTITDNAPPTPASVSTPYPRYSLAPSSPPRTTINNTSRAEQEITATELVQAYQASRLRAEERFNNKTIRVTGTVKARGRDALKKPFILLAAEGYDISVRCLFDGKQKLDPQEVEMGGEATVQGICGGSFVDVTLVECELR